jgi:SAM-dependent methyltransferase
MSDDPRETDVDLQAVYDVVATAPDGEHTPGTTLAPACDALIGAGPASEAAGRLERYLPLATSVVDVETGAGRLFDCVNSFPTVLGTESRPGLAARATTRGPVVRAHPTALPVASADAVAAFGTVSARLDDAAFERFVREVHGALSPGGTFLFDALLRPSGIDDRPLSVTDGTVEVHRERSVEAGGPGAIVHETYELIDRALDDRLTVERTVARRTLSPAVLWETLTEAGFADLMMTTREVDDGAVLVVADREGQLSPDGLTR